MYSYYQSKPPNDLLIGITFLDSSYFHAISTTFQEEKNNALNNGRCLIVHNMPSAVNFGEL